MRKDRKAVPLMSLKEAAARGIERVRQPNWVGEFDHIKIDLLPDGKMGPWAHIYSPMNQSINGRDPVDMLCLKGIGVDPDAQGGYAYTGPLPDSDEYKAEVARCTEGVPERRSVPQEKA